MPRPSKGPRLYLKPARRTREGKLKERSAWIIRDGGKDTATGCPAPEISKAEIRFAEYLAEKHSPSRTERDIERISIADVLSIFVDDRREYQSNKKDSMSGSVA